MTEHEIFQNTMAHRHTGKFLYQVLFTPFCEQRFREYLGEEESVNLDELFGIFPRNYIGPKKPECIKNPDFSVYYKDIVIPANAWINKLGVLEIPGSSYHFTYYISPLRKIDDADEIDRFPIDIGEEYQTEHLLQEVREKHNQGRVAVSRCGMMYEDAWQIRGYEEFLMDMMTCPENCDILLDKLCERNKRTAIACAKAGVDILYFGDDVANQRSMMFSVDIWRTFLKSRWAEVFAAVKAIRPEVSIWYHSDGNIAPIIPELIEIGVDIINPVQPECMDPVEIKRLYGNRIVIDGAIGTQTVMPFGTPQDVRSTVRSMKEKLGYDGAYIISPTHRLEPEVPPENIVAFLEECSR